MFSNFKFNLSNKTNDSETTTTETTTTETTTTETTSTETTSTETTTTENNEPSLNEPLFNINFDGKDHKVSVEYLVTLIEKQGDIINNLREEKKMVLKLD